MTKNRVEAGGKRICPMIVLEGALSAIAAPVSHGESVQLDNAERMCVPSTTSDLTF